jgi:hypothetical protein
VLEARLPEPWKSFLEEVDADCTGPAELHCVGGFVLTALYGMPRPTADVDVLSIAPRSERELILEIAGMGSPLHKKSGLYIQLVTIAAVPEDYERRMAEIFPSTFSQLKLLALDAYDIALSKIERNSQRDRDDVRFLKKRVPLDLRILRQRYLNELRPLLGNPQREDLTLKLWMEMLSEND